MMKNKLFVSLLCSLTLGLALVACQPEVETFESSRQIANATLVGKDSVRSVAKVSDLTMTIVEYKFLPENKAERTVRTFGDGVYETFDPVRMSYAMEYAENYVGFNLTFTPEDGEKEPFLVYFNEDLLVENDGKDTIPEKLAKLANLEKIIADLPGTAWNFEESTLWIDTTKVDSIYEKVISSKIPGPDGKPIVVKDTVLDTLSYELYDTIGVMTYTKAEFSVARDANTLANTGHYFYEHLAYDREGNKIDSLSTCTDFDARWGLYSITTAKRFGLRMVSEDKTKQEDLAISLFTVSEKDGSLKVGGTKEFKLKK